jgi:hypothetical protein
MSLSDCIEDVSSEEKICIEKKNGKEKNVIVSVGDRSSPISERGFPPSTHDYSEISSWKWSSVIFVHLGSDFL